jgi:hypothetical protein
VPCEAVHDRSATCVGERTEDRVDVPRLLKH